MFYLVVTFAGAVMNNFALLMLWVYLVAHLVAGAVAG